LLCCRSEFSKLLRLIQYLTGLAADFHLRQKYYLEEATGTYINRNHFAGFLEMILPFAVVLALRWRGCCFRIRQAERLHFAKLLPDGAASLVFWLFLANPSLRRPSPSRSRMGTISALVSLVAILALDGTASMRARTRRQVAALFFLGVLGLVVWIGSDPVMSRFRDSRPRNTISTVKIAFRFGAITLG